MANPNDLASSQDEEQLSASRSLVDPESFEQVDQFLQFEEKDVKKGKSNIVISFENRESGNLSTRVFNDYEVARSFLENSFKEESTDKVAGIAFFNVAEKADFDIEKAKQVLGEEIKRIRDSLPKLTVAGIFGDKFQGIAH